MDPASKLLDSMFVGNSDDQDERERESMLLEAAKDELTRAERKALEAQSRLQGAQSAYQQSVKDHVIAKKNASNWDVLVMRLRVHVKDNLLYYMQAIWAHTMPDQMFFDLHDVKVPDIKGSFFVKKSADILTAGAVSGATASEFEAIFKSAVGTNHSKIVPLVEIAELDELLGFKGNYAVFPMRESNPVTDIVMAPFLDEHEVLRDPLDPAANWTITSLKKYADDLRASDAENGSTDFDDNRDYIEKILSDLLADSRPSEDIVVVPSDSLYVDLLMTGGKLLEEFKEKHRAIDVVKARAEAREIELENLRRAARINKDELSDPDLDEYEHRILHRE